MFARILNLFRQAEITAGVLVKVALLNALLIGVFGLRYLSGTQTWTVWQSVYFLSLLIGQFFCLSLVLYFVVGWPLAKLRLHKCSILWVFAVTLTMLVLVVADTYVFDQFRMHINLAMLEMTLLGGGQIVVFSARMIFEIALMIFGLAVLSALIIVTALGVNLRKSIFAGAIGIVMIAFIGANLTYAVAFPVKKTSILSVTDRVPYAQPLRMTKLLLKVGVVTKEEMEKVKTVSVSENSSFNYPLAPLTCSGVEKPLNIVFLFVDAMRNDVFNKQNTPNLWKFSQTKDTSVFNNYYSGGNCTRTGIFTAFYGIPGKYWFAALSSNKPSAFMTALQERDYQIGTFTSATLTRPEFHATVFSGVKDLRLNPRGNTSFERDQFSVDDFIEWQKKLPKDKNFFSFIFLDNVHACNVPDDERFHVYKPFWKSVNQLELNNETDPQSYFNRYRNSVYWVDTQIGRVLDHLEKSNLLDNTIVVVSADHAEEFNDNKLNYWHHNGNYTDPQIKVPLVVHWPGKTSRRIDTVTSSVDLVATILPEALGCKNPVKDYSVGESLWNMNRTRQWFHSASYSTYAFVEPERIVLINKLGLLEYQNKSARPAQDESVPKYLREAMEELTRYYQK